MTKFSANLPQNPVNAYFLTISTSSQQSYFYRLREFCGVVFGYLDFNKCNWRDFSYLQVLHYINIKRDSGASLDSINTTIAILKSVALHAWQMNFITVDSYMKIKAIKRLRSEKLPKGRCLPLSEILQIKRHLDRDKSALGVRNQAIFALCVSGGLRRTEVLSLKVENFNFDDKAYIIDGKGQKQRLMPLSIRTINRIKSWLAISGIESGHLFINLRTGEKLSLPAINNLFNKLSGITGRRFTSHDLRRTFATHLIDRDIDLFVVQSLLGHTSVNTTRIYDRRGDSAKAHAINALPF